MAPNHFRMFLMQDVDSNFMEKQIFYDLYDIFIDHENIVESKNDLYRAFSAIFYDLTQKNVPPETFRKKFENVQNNPIRELFYRKFLSKEVKINPPF